MSAFKRGDKVYISDGTAAWFVSDLGNGEAVVSLIISDEYDEATYSSTKEALTIVNRVFEKPPIYEIHAATAKARTDLDLILAQQQAAREALAGMEKTHRNRHAALSKWEGFSLLEAFLEKRITHVVIVEYYGAKIITFDECMAYREDHGRINGMKLLSLFGKSNGSLEWNVNQYNDGSGSNTRIYPATSYEEAVAHCRKLFDADMAEALNDPNKLYNVGSWIERVPALGFEVPQVLMERWRARQIANATENVEKAKKLLAEYEVTLAKAQK